MNQETQWISEIKKGNIKAFNSVYDFYADKIFYTSVRFHLTHEEAKEMVQTTFLTLWEKRETLNPHLSLNAFLLTITKNRILNFHKRKVIELACLQKYISYHDAFANTTEDTVLFTEIEKCTFDFIETLPERKKQIFLLSRREGLCNDEIAQILNVSKRTVENNIYQAELTILLFLKKNKLLERCFVFILIWLVL